MQIDFLQKPAPNVFECVSRPRFNRIRWDMIGDPEHKTYAVYRYTSFANATADTSATLVSDEIVHLRFRDDDGLTLNTDYWYRVASIDQWGNQSAKSGIVSTKYQGVKDADIDGDMPGTPSGVSIAPGALARQDDGTIIAHVTVTFTAPVTGAPVKLYRIKRTHNVSGEVRWFETDASPGTVPAETGKSFNYQVRAISTFNIPGSLTTAVAYTRPKKTSDMPAPGTITVSSNKKRLKLDWVDIDDDTYPDYRITYIYRNTVNTAPTLGTTTPFKKTKAGYFIDDNVTTGINYYYWIVHKDNSGNYGALSVVAGPVASGGSEVTSFSDLSGSIAGGQIPNGTITDPHTLQTAPTTPIGLSIGVGSIEVLDDGTIQANAVVSWTAVSTGVPFTHYRIKQTQVSNSEVQFFDVPDGTVSKAVPVKTGKSYNYQVTTVTFNNIEGAYSTAVAYTRPKKTGSVPAVGTVTATGLKKRIKLDWTDVDDDTNPDYRITYIYKNTVATVPTLGTTTPFKKTKAGQFVDDNVTNATNYYYHVVHKDNSGNFGTISATVGPVTSGGGEVTSFADLTGVAASNQLAMTDPNSYAENSDLALGPNVGWSHPASIISDGANAYAGTYVIKNAYSGVATSYVNRNALIFPVRVGEQYTLGGMAKTDGSWAGGNYGWRLSALDETKVEIASSFLTGTAVINTTWTEGQLIYTVPAGVAFLRLEFAVYNQTAGTAFGSHGYVRPTVTPLMTDQRLPSAPTSVSVGVGSIELDEDGHVVANAAVTWAAPATNASLVASYRIKVTQVSNSEVRFFASNTLSALIPVKTGKSYNYQICGITFNEKEGTYNTAVAYTRPKKAGAVPAVGTVTATGLKKRIKLDWTDIDDDANPDYRITYIYKNTVATVPTLGTTTPYKKTKSGQFVDDNVANATNYYYHVVHKDNSGNFGTISGTIGPVQSGGGEVTAFADLTGSIAGGQIPAGTVTGVQTDQTVPSAPTSLSAGAGSIEIDDDGKKEAMTALTWSAPTTNAALVKMYRIKVTQVTTSEVRFFESNTLSATIPVKTGRAYNYQVCGVTFNENEGAYNTAVSYTRPKKAGSLPAPGTVVLTPGKKRINVTWPAVDEGTYPDYNVTYLYRNTVNTAPTLGTTAPYRKLKGNAVLDEGVTTGTTYYYWVAHKDDAGYFGALSSVQSATSLGNEVSAFADLTGLLTAPMITPFSVDSPAIAPRAILPSKLNRPPIDNRVKDYDLVEKENLYFTQFLTSAGSGTEVAMPSGNAVQMPNPSSDHRGKSNFKFRMTAPAVSYSLRVETDRLAPVEEGLAYAFDCYMTPVVAWSTVFTVYMRARWYTIDSLGVIIYLSETTTLWSSPTNSHFSWGFVPPSDAVYASLQIEVRAVTGQLLQMDFASPIIRQLPRGTDITAFAKELNLPQNIFGNTTGTTLVDIAAGRFVRPLRSVVRLECHFRFKNISNATCGYTVSVEYNGLTFTTFEETLPVILRDGEMCEGTIIGDCPASIADDMDQAAFRLRVDPDQTGNILTQSMLAITAYYS